MKNYCRCVATGLLLFFLFVAPAAAQIAVTEVNEGTLTSLYQALLKKEDQKDAYLEKRITDERSRIRKAFDEEIDKFLSDRAKEEGQAAEDLTGTLERQRVVVASFEERLRGSEVDLELLNEEEKKYYLTVSPPSDGDEYRLTKSHAELLTKKAILEERIAAVKFFLVPQTERLQKLTLQQRIAQFSVLITFAKYLGLILLVFFLERLIRTRLFTKIQNRNRRYASMKIFTSGVYVLMIAWLLSRLFSEHPGVVTSFAIIGAGLAVSLQDVVKDFIGWFVIVQGRRYSLGQRIAVGNQVGDVIDISPLRTTLLEVAASGNADFERTGKTLYLPNSLVLTQSLVNFNTTSDFIKAEMHITITYESDWKKAGELLEHILKEETEEFSEKARRQGLSRTQQFYFSHEARIPVIYIDLAPSGVLFTLRFYVPIGERRIVISAITKKILERFHAADPRIDLAYNTTRVYATSMTAAEIKQAGAAASTQHQRAVNP